MLFTRCNFPEKTEMIRKANNSSSDVKLVQMYGALTSVESPCRPDSTNTNRSELGHEPDSEDDQSLRTMIVCVNLFCKYSLFLFLVSSPVNILYCLC